MKGFYGKMVAGYKFEIKRSLVENLTNSKENEVLAKKRVFNDDLKSVHISTIEHILLDKKDGPKLIFTGDLKGTLIGWKLGEITAL